MAGVSAVHDIIDAFDAWGIDPPLIRITDVGAMDVGSGSSWDRLVKRGCATLLGFEPQQEECARYNAKKGAGHRCLPQALGDGTVRTFHQCHYAPTSSFYKPNRDVIEQYNGLCDLMEVVGTVPMATSRLDDIEEARSTDFLKLDVQGAELDILTHGRETLKHVSMIQTEVSFQPLYENQPLFADVDAFLRKEGFVLHTFLGFGRRMMRPLVPTGGPFAGFNQILWSDAVYIKPFASPPAGQEPATLLKRAILFHELYRSYDFAARALRDYGALTGRHVVEAYPSLVNQEAAAAA
ncbi:MAG: FkbM family methyltransferase [Rhizobiales bacterium]|nr:FkbM family methyltransferase [Hyphomicrobiales bacterium]